MDDFLVAAYSPELYPKKFTSFRHTDSAPHEQRRHEHQRPLSMTYTGRFLCSLVQVSLWFDQALSIYMGTLFFFLIIKRKKKRNRTKYKSLKSRTYKRRLFHSSGLLGRYRVSLTLAPRYRLHDRTGGRGVLQETGTCLVASYAVGKLLDHRPCQRANGGAA